MSAIAPGEAFQLPPGFMVTEQGTVAPVRWISATDFDEQLTAARSLLGASALSIAQTERDPDTRRALLEMLDMSVGEEIPQRVRSAQAADDVANFRRAYTDLWRAVGLLDFDDDHVVHVPRSEIGVAAAPTVFEVQERLPAVEPLFRRQAADWHRATGHPAETFLQFTGPTGYVGGVDGKGHVRIGGTPVTFDGLFGAEGFADRIETAMQNAGGAGGTRRTPALEWLRNLGGGDALRGTRLRVDPDLRYQMVAGLSVAMDRLSDVIEGAKPMRLATALR